MAEGKERGLVTAAGAVVWRPGSAGPDVALVHRPRYDDWSYPKGKRQPGEHLLRTAIREVREETGFAVVLGRPLTASVYPTAGGTKQVSYWVARFVESCGLVPNDEVDEVAWLPAATAGERLSYERDVALAEEFLAGPAQTTPLILLRHAAAGAKPDVAVDQAAAADLARPLDPLGSADAQILAGLLACYGRCQVISSAAERCLATVRPYARAVGAQVQAEADFAVAPEPVPPADLLMAVTGRDRPWAGTGGRPGEMRGPWRDAGQGARRSAALAASGVPTLICAHRENLPGLIDAAFTALGASPPASEPLGKGEFWVLQAAGGALVSAERHSPAA